MHQKMCNWTTPDSNSVSPKKEKEQFINPYFGLFCIITKISTNDFFHKIEINSFPCRFNFAEVINHNSNIRDACSQNMTTISSFKN